VAGPPAACTRTRSAPRPARRAPAPGPPRGPPPPPPPRLWVARTGGFSLVRGPTESGFRDAYIWQGVLDTQETWGGVTLRIDANVARSASPST
jgi:hypothetical protein